MIKILALIFMLIDHIGAIIFTSEKFRFLRIIGRLAMPLFGYCIARGFDHYLKKGSGLFSYFKKLVLFAICSTIPYQTFICLTSNVDVFKFNWNAIFKCFCLNIGFTWVCSVIVLYCLHELIFNSGGNTFSKKNLTHFTGLILVTLFSIFVHMDYGLAGVLVPVSFYFFYFKFYNSFALLISNFLIYVIYCFLRQLNIFDNPTFQIFSIFSVFIVLFLKNDKLKFKLPKYIFYWFYPLHLTVLVIIRYCLNKSF